MQNVINWLLRDGAEVSDEDLVAHLAAGLREGGVPIDRLWIGQRVHHPLIASRALTWTEEEGAQVFTLPFSMRERMQTGLNDAIGDGKLHRIDTKTTPRGALGLPADLWDRYSEIGIVFNLAGHLRGFFCTLATRSPGGLPADTEVLLQQVLPMVDIVLHSRSALEFARIVATTYLGAAVGGQVYGGMIHRGEGETIRAAIWLSDLRGFSALSEQLELPELLSLLDDAFEAQVGAVEAAGGQVLKFMGDGMLAVFRVEDGDESAQSACDRALRAADDVHRRMAEVRATREERGLAVVDYGVALHFGDVMFGNIGAPHRLDFTVIGRAVNLTARLETRSGALGVPLVLSEDFSRLCSSRTRIAERATLKGVGVQDVYVLDDQGR